MNFLKLLFGLAFLSDNVLDEGLDYLTTNLNRLDICSQEPATYTEATSTYTLGNKTGASCGAAQNGDVSGRKVIITAVTDGTVSGTGSASHWAASYVVGVELLAAESLAAPQGVTSGNTWTLPAFDIESPDPV